MNTSSKQFTPVICLGCHKHVDGSFKCRCGWPMCSKECCYAPIHKATNECDILAKCRLKPKLNEGLTPSENPIYECITPMRCALIKKQCPDNWEVMMRMEQHTEQRKCEPFYPVNQTNTVKFLNNHVLHDEEEKELYDPVSEEELNSIVDLMDVNAFEIRGTDFSMRGVYPLTAMMNSVCSPNTQNCIDRNFICRVRAVVPIKKGQEITATYTHTLSGTMYRQKHLMDSKYFICQCVRCKDPTELGSHFSSFYCQNCSNQGLVMSTDPTNVFAVWKCNACQHSLKAKEVEEIVETLEKEVANLPLERDVYEEKLNTLAKLLHENHHIMIDIKFTLVQLYGRDQPSKTEMIKHALRKKELCESVIEVLDKVIPGRFRMRGMFLSEMYGILFFLAKRAYQNGEINQRNFLNKLEDAKDVLEESMEILSYEPTDTVEGVRCQTTKEFKEQLNKLIAAHRSELDME